MEERREKTRIRVQRQRAINREIEMLHARALDELAKLKKQQVQWVIRCQCECKCRMAEHKTCGQQIQCSNGIKGEEKIRLNLYKCLG